MSKNVLFENKQLYWIDLFKEEWKHNCTHVDHNQLADPLPFKKSYTINQYLLV